MARRFWHWAQAGVWEALFQAVQEPNYAWVLIDSTMAKAHKAAAGQKKHLRSERRKSQPGRFLDEGTGHRRRLRTHAGRSSRKSATARLTGGVARAARRGGRREAHDTNNVFTTLAQYQVETVIPPKVNRLIQWAYDENLYADRNKIKRFFGRLKEARGLATRYEKTATPFLIMAHLPTALNWMG